MVMHLNGDTVRAFTISSALELVGGCAGTRVIIKVFLQTCENALAEQLRTKRRVKAGGKGTEMKKTDLTEDYDLALGGNSNREPSWTVKKFEIKKKDFRGFFKVAALTLLCCMSVLYLKAVSYPEMTQHTYV